MVRNLGIRTKIVVSTVVVVVTALAAVTVLVTARASGALEENAEAYGAEVAARFAADVHAELASASSVARNLAGALAAMKLGGVADRRAYAPVHRTLLEANPGLFGVWSGWEPNAIDGDDERYADTPGHDATGRYLPYYNRGGADGSMRLDVLVDYDTPGVGDYYQVPFTTGEEKVIDPYRYPVDDREFLMATVSVPIEVTGTIVGVAGVDVLLDDLAARIAQIRPLGEGSAMLVSSNGSLVAGSDDALLGEPLPADSPFAPLVTAATSTGSLVADTGADPRTGKDALLFAVPIPVGPNDTWTLGVAVPKSAALEAVQEIRTVAIVVTIIAALLAAVALAVVATSIARPVRRMTRVMERLAEGGTDVDIPALGQRDEIGDMAAAVAVFKDALAENERLAREQEDLKRAAEEERRRAFEHLADRFEHAVNGIVTNVAASAEQVEQSASSMSMTTDDLNQSVRSISTEIVRSGEVTRSAVAQAEEAGRVVTGLTDAADRIGEAVTLIRSIAEQTNLLALNATIEAARAGDAGRGFAVVANEVKELAAQTERATADVAGRIAAIQASTGEAAEALDRIGRIVADIDGITAAITSALSDRDRGVEAAVNRSRHEAEALQSAAVELSAQAATLRAEVEGFTATVRGG